MVDADSGRKTNETQSDEKTQHTDPCTYRQTLTPNKQLEYVERIIKKERKQITPSANYLQTRFNDNLN